MMVLDRNYRFLEETEEAYVTSLLIVNDDLRIDLDKELVVNGHVYIAGNLNSSVSIAAQGTFICIGNVSSESISAKDGVTIKGKLDIDGDILSSGNIILDKVSSTGSIVSNATILLNGKESFLKDVAAKESVISYGNLSLKGRISAGDKIDVHGRLHVGEAMKIAGMEVSSYARISFKDITVNVYDKVASLSLGGSFVGVIKDYSNMSAEEYKKEDIEAISTVRPLLDIAKYRILP